MPENYNPLPILWPEVARISVGCSSEGMLAVRVQSTTGLDSFDGPVRESFNQAAAAFIREFSGSQAMRELQIRKAAPGTKLDQAGREAAEEAGAAVTDLTGEQAATDVS